MGEEGDAVEEAGGAALRCSVVFHIALGENVNSEKNS